MEADDGFPGQGEIEEIGIEGKVLEESDRRFG